MSNVIKRRHTAQYAQIHNTPLQEDLDDLRAIGLLSHLMSLPHDWTIYKTQLHSRFSRKNVDAAWKILVSKNYIIGFSCYVNGKKSYFYNVSDIPFTSEEFSEFVREELSESTEKGKTVKHIAPIDGLTLVTTEFSTDVPKVQQVASESDSTGAPSVQYSENSTKSATTKEIYTNEIQTKKDIKIDDDIANSVSPAPEENNYNVVIEILREETKDHLAKRSFDSVVRKVMDKHKQGKVKNFRDYLISSLNAKIEELELRRIKDKVKQENTLRGKSEASSEYTGKVAFFNFLDEEETRKAQQPLKIS